jgi:hypothetical protein
VASVASKLQIKPGQSVCVIGRPQGVTLDLGQEPLLVQDPGGSDAVIVYATNSADLNRDKLAARLKTKGVRPVRQIAVDDVWSALRLRPA